MVNKSHCLRVVASAILPVVHAGSVDVGAERIHKKIPISELPLYENPLEKVTYEYVDDHGKIHHFLREQIATPRAAVHSAWKSFESTWERIRDIYGIGKAHTMDTAQRVASADKNAFLAVIAGAAVGVLISRKVTKGRFGKYAFGVLGGVSGAALFYPTEAVDLSVKIFNKSKDKITGKTSDTPSQKEDTTQKTEDTEKS